MKWFVQDWFSVHKFVVQELFAVCLSFGTEILEIFAALDSVKLAELLLYKDFRGIVIISRTGTIVDIVVFIISR